MPLQKQPISINLSQGIDTKTDPKQVVMGKLLVLQNAFFRSLKRIVKRFGYAALTQNILGGGTISSGQLVSTYNSEIVETDGQNLYSYSVGSASWAKKGAQFNVSLTATPVIRNSNAQTQPDSAINGSYQCFVWTDSSGGSRYSIFDTKTNQAIVSNVQVSSVGKNSKVLAIGTLFVIIFVDSGTGNIRYCSINTSTITAISSPTTLESTVYFSIYDACVINNTIYVAYSATATTVGIFTLNTSLVQGSVTTITGTNAPFDVMAIFGDASNNVWVSFKNSLTAILYATVYPAALGTPTLALTVVDNTLSSGQGMIGISGAVIGTTATLIYTVVNVSGGLTFGSTKSNTITISGTAGTPISINYKASLVSKAFVYNSQVFAVVSFLSTLEPTYFLINSSGQIACKISPQTGYGTVQLTPQISNVNQVSTNVFQICYLQQDFITTIGGNIYSQTGVMQSNITFNTSPVQSLTLGNDLLISGGFPSMYDGTNVVELGFHLYPDYPQGLTGSTTANPIISYLIGAGGALGPLQTGASQEIQYSYEETYSWTDNQGQIHESAPSPAAIYKQFEPLYSVTFSSGATTLTFQVAFFAPLPYVGMLLTGTGIAAGTYITTISVSGPNITIGISAATTASGSSALIQFTPQYTVQGDAAGINKNTNGAIGTQVNIQQPQYAPVIITVGGSSVTSLTLASVSGIVVGMTIVVRNTSASTADSRVITAISGNTISFASATSVTSYDYGYIGYPFTATVTSGSTTVSGVPTSVIANMAVNDRVYSALFTGGSAIVNFVGSTSFGIGVAAATSGSLVYLAMDLTTLLKVGQQLIGNSIDSEIVQVVGGVEGSGSYVLLNSSAGTIDQSVHTYTIPNVYSAAIMPATLTYTSKQNVIINIYRTQINGTNYNKVSVDSSPLLNNPNIAYASFLDTVPDITANGNEPLYTTGGVVDNIAAPAFTAMTSFKNRAIIIPSESPLTFWSSKQVIPGTPVQFSDELVENVDQRIGAIAAVSVMDDKLVLFGKNNVFYIVGDGPSANGLNNDFTEAQLISTDTGCNNPASIVLMPDGLMFQSPKGIYLLARGLEVSYIGAEVASFNSFTVTSAELVETLNQVRFTITNGTALVYDYFVKQWSVFTNISAVSATSFEGNYTYLNAAGLVQSETPNLYSDNGSYIPISLTTSWMSFATLQGFQRVYEFLFLGDYFTQHFLTFNLFTDFSSSADSSVSIDASQFSGVPYQFRVFPVKPQCEAFQIQITESGNGTVIDRGLSISALSLTAGVKGRDNTTPAAQSFG